MQFEWICHDCKLILEKEYDIGKAPQKKKCPTCKKMAERNYEGINVSFNNDFAFQTVRRRYEKHGEKGFDKDAANRFLTQSCHASKVRMNEQEHMYKKVFLDYDKMAKDGKVKKLSQRETSEKLERAKKLTAKAYDRAKLDIYKPQKQQ